MVHLDNNLKTLKVKVMLDYLTGPSVIALLKINLEIGIKTICSTHGIIDHIQLNM